MKEKNTLFYPKNKSSASWIVLDFWVIIVPFPVAAYV